MQPHVHHIPEGAVIRWTEAIKTSIRLQHEDKATEVSELLYCFASVNFSTASVSYNVLSSQLSSIQFSHSLVPDSATSWTAAARPPCPSPTPRVTQTHVH